ncbi:MAG: S41 family peptidase [Bryobacteraceae bacterium]
MSTAALLLLLAPLTVQQKQANIASFEQVWKTVRDTHWEPQLGGIDWQGAHDELRPAIEKAETMDQARDVMRSLLSRLQRSHYGILPAEVYTDVDGDGVMRGAGRTGMDVRVVDGRALVTAVEAGTPAAARNIQPGWEIVAVAGKDIAPSLARISETYKASTQRDMILMRSVYGRLTGAPGDRTSVRFLDGNGRTVDLEVSFTDPKGKSARFGNLPVQHVWIESRKLPGGAGWIGFNLFLDPARLMAAFEDAVKSFAGAPGIVVDLRGNPGGIGLMAMGMAGWFIEEGEQPLGAMQMRQAPLRFVVNPRFPQFKGKLAILIDGCSASTSEIFAGGMKDLGRARVFGTRSAGAALPSVIDKLPNGDGFQYATANYISKGGKPLEGIGVLPDVEAKPSRDSLLAGRDAALDAALQWIHQKN